MAEHKHGSMDTTEQEKTFDGFMRFSIWTVVVIIVALIVLAMINA